MNNWEDTWGEEDEVTKVEVPHPSRPPVPTGDTLEGSQAKKAVTPSWEPKRSVKSPWKRVVAHF